MRLRLIFLILLSLSLFHCKTDTVSNAPEAKKGILDLRQWNFQKDGNVSLDGEWIFSFEKKTPIYIPVPSQWQDQGFPLYGTADYRLKILLPEHSKAEAFAILLPDISMAYDLYTDGNLTLSTGKTGNSKEEYSPFLRHRFSALKTSSNETELLIRVSNFHSTKSGILGKIKLGSSSILRAQTERSKSLDYIVFGCLLIMGVHNISIYMFRKKDKVPLFFGLFCILIALRTVSVNECCILDYLPDLPFTLIYRLEYAPFYMGVPLFAMFLYSLFPREFTTRALRIFKYTGIPLTLTAASSPIEMYIRLLPIFELYAFLFAVYSSVTVFLAVIHRRPGAKLFCAGGFPFFWTIINDLLLNMQFIYTFYMGSYGFLIFIYFHSVALSRRFSRNITFAELQSEELQGKTEALEEINSELYELKGSLEKKVQERTVELEKARQITEEANQELQDLNKFTKLINSAKNLDYILNQIYDYIRKNMELGIFWLVLFNDEKNELYNYKWILPEDNGWAEDQKAFLTDFRIPLTPNIGTLYQTFVSREIFYLPDIYRSVSGSKNHFINEFNGKVYFSKRLDLKILTVGKFESFVQIPLIVNDRTIGILNLAPIDRKASLEKRELFSLIQFGEQIAGVIQNMHLLEETEKARQESALQKQLAEKTKEELEVLNSFNRMINELSDLDHIFTEISKYIYERYNIEDVWLLLADEKKKELFPLRSFEKAKLSEAKMNFKNEFRIPLNEEGGLNYILYKRQKPLYVQKIKNIPHPTDRLIIENLEVKSFLNVPMLIQGNTVGIVYFSNSTKEFHLSKKEIASINGFCQQIAGVIHNSHLLKETEDAKKEAEKEREKSDRLLLNILPIQVAGELKEKGSADPVFYQSVTVMFTDFKGFTEIAEKMSPTELIKELDGCFSQFDKITERYKLEKLKTIGDSYMCAGGVPAVNSTHAADSVLAALEIQNFMNMMKALKEEKGFPYWELRLGIHSGPLVAGVIGEKKFAYDVWGDTVNTASRMESSGTPGRINISGETYRLVKDLFQCSYRGRVNAKNKGEVEMYYVNGIIQDLSKNGDGKTPNEKFWERYSTTLL